MAACRCLPVFWTIPVCFILFAWALPSIATATGVEEGLRYCNGTALSSDELSKMVKRHEYAMDTECIRNYYLNVYYSYKKLHDCYNKWLEKSEMKTVGCLWDARNIEKKENEFKSTCAWWIDLSGAHLKNATLAHARLAWAELSRAILFGADLQNSVLMQANLKNADLAYATLSKAILSGAMLHNANMTEANLANAVMIQAKLRNATMSGAQLWNANLRGADLTEADLSGAHLLYADLTSAILEHADLSETSLQRSLLSGARLRCANMTAAKLYQANMTAANLEDVVLSGADLRHANLRRANLWNAILTGADLSSAYLPGCNLWNATLNGANLFNANMTGSEINSAQLPGTNMHKATLSGVILDRSNLSNADLSSTRLDNASLVFTNIRNAKLYDASLNGAIYAPIGIPNKDYLGEVKGLSTLVCNASFLSGPIQLRNALRAAGLRESEREVTYAIERARTAAADLPERWFKTVLFDWPSAYGMYPGRPLWLLLSMFLAFIPIYWAALWRRKDMSQDDNVSRNKKTQEPEQPQAAVFMALILAAAATLAGALLFSAAYYLAQRPDWPRPGAMATLVFCILILAYWLVLWRAGSRGDCRQRRGKPQPEPRQLPPPQRFEALVVSIIPGLIAAGLFTLPVYFGVNRDFPVLCLTLVVAFCIAVPAFWLARLRAAGGDGVYRAWSEKRVRQDLGEKRPLRLRRSFWQAMPWAAYFSLLSSFNLGFREINVGNWIARIQPREYALQATGWVRTVAGVQSLLSFYLLALWVLTYFGRPFE